MSRCKTYSEHKLAESATGEMLSIGVGVGSKRETFSIHKNLLKKCTHHFDKLIDSEAGQKGLVFLNDEDPKIFKMFKDWLYSGKVEKPPVEIKIRTMPSAIEVERLETDLRHRFNSHQQALVDLYCCAEKYGIENLANRTIDAIQDGFFDYGTVFGPGLLRMIFIKTKVDSPLRDLCVAANVIHMDRGCSKLRSELMMTSITIPGFFSPMLKWISQNYAIFAKRHEQGWNNMIRNAGFTVLNRKCLCTCHFHTHAPGKAHKNHNLCNPPTPDCSHPGDDDVDAKMFNGLLSMFAFGGLGIDDIDDSAGEEDVEMEMDLDELDVNIKKESKKYGMVLDELEVKIKKEKKNKSDVKVKKENMK